MIDPRAPRGAPQPPGRRVSGGDELLLVFFAATMVMVIAVVLVGAVLQWWVLVPVMLVDLGVTFAVIATLLHLLGHDGPPSS
jgi:fatty acid desaturase